MNIWHLRNAALVLALGVGSTALVRGQQPAPAPSDPNVQSTPAIAYSQMQAPVPEPAAQGTAEPIPPTQQPQTQTEDRSAPGRPGQGPPTQSATAQPRSAGAIRGNIVKTAAGYVLNTASGLSYTLDDQKRASKFEGMQVTVTGDVDPEARKIRITNIEPAS
ncbi:MAG TPA: DUF5818 domain-containing protein [Terriglobales bacterium]|nr:DUF5818 domain-containing protein [Terriglobales bacterium]